MRNKLQESVNLNKQLKLEVQKLRTVVFDTNIPKNQKHKQVFETFNKEILIKDLLIHDQQIEIQGLLKLNQSKQQEIKYLKLKNGQIETQKLSVSQNLDNLSSIMQEYQKSTNEVEYLKDEVDQIAGVLLKEEQFYKQKCILLETQLQQKCELLEQAQLEIYDYKIDIQTKDEIIEKQNKSNSFKYKQNVQLRRELNDIREEVLNTTNKQDNQEADITPQNIRQQNLLKINQSQQIYIQRLEDALYSANDQAALDVQLQSPELNYYKQQNVLQSQEISLLKLQTQQHQCNKVLQGSPDDQKTVVEQLHLLRKIYNNMQGNAQDQLIALQISNNELKQQLNIVFHQHELFQKAENPLYINAHQQILQYRYLIDQLRDHIQQQNQIINVGYF
ncbi:hypothetical protein SS50377_26957 [Spironucleus salmonicida]|nr:hypothetical protein SS50377_26957 [Spironucleus salmonicida]